MLEINASPELCYVLWVLWLFLTFFIYSVFTLAARERAKKKHWGLLCLYIGLHLIGIYNMVMAVADVSAWYNILAQLKGW